MVELSASLRSGELISDEEDTRFPGWHFDRSYDSVQGSKPYRCRIVQAECRECV